MRWSAGGGSAEGSPCPPALHQSMARVPVALITAAIPCLLELRVKHTNTGLLGETVRTFSDNVHAFSQTVAGDLDERAIMQTHGDWPLHRVIALHYGNH